MKTLTTFFPAVLILGVFIAIFVGVRFARDGLGVFGWILFVVGLLLIAWVIASLVNFAIFAPVFWLLGKLGRRKTKGEQSHEHDA